MISTPAFLSYIFGGISFLYAIFGFIVVGLDTKENLNRIFFLLSTTASIWSLMFSLAINSNSYASAYHFYILASIGYAFFYSNIFHMTKILTKEKISKSFLFYTYLPSTIFLTVFLIFSTTSTYKPISLIISRFGFIYSFNYNIINYFFNLYAIVFVILTVRLHKRVLKANDSYKNSSHIKRITYSFVISFILAVITDVILIDIFNVQFFYLAVIWYSFPIFAFFILFIKTKKVLIESNSIYNQKIKKSSKQGIFILLSLFYITLGYSELLLNDFFSGYLKSGILVDMILFFLIAFVHISFVNRIKNEKFQNIFLLITATTIECFILYTFRESFAINIWAIIFLYTIISIVFEQKRYIYTFSISMVIIYIIFMQLNPSGFVLFSSYYHITRILIFIIISVFVIYVNTLFEKNRVQNINYFETKDVMSSVFESIISVNITNIEPKVFYVLNKVNQGFNLLKSHYFIFSLEDMDQLEVVYMVDKFGDHIRHDFKNTIFEISPYFMEKAKAGEAVFLPSIDNTDLISIEAKKIFFEQGVEGLFSLPILLNGNLKTVVVFEFKINKKSVLISDYELLLKGIILETIYKLESEKEIFVKNNYDLVTGLMKKRYFKKTIEQIVKNNSSEYYIIYIIFSNFSFINEYVGHFNADFILKELAKKLLNLCGSYVSKFESGDVVIFVKANQHEIMEYIDKINDELNKGINLNNNIIKIGLNMGLANVEGSVIEAVKNASIAVKKAKENLVKNYQFYDSEMKNQIFEEHTYTQRIENALENNEFTLHFQPQIDTKTEKIIGAECLLRWYVEGIGNIPPNKFIPILENTGKIIKVGNWIIEEAMKMSSYIQKNNLGDIKISINLSPIQFLDINLYKEIKKLSEKYQLNNELIEFEITESISLKKSQILLDIFKNIKEMGFKVAIDDFGTAYSSLNRLHYFPIDTLKIDKSFIDGIGVDQKKESVVDIILDLSKKLNLVSIAEGVETKKQLDYLRERNCDEIQGYYYAKPMPKNEFEEFIKNY